VMFHAWWHQCHCDMYRFTIPGFREGLPIDELQDLPVEFTSNCRDKCLEHALAVSEVMNSVMEIERDIFITDTSLAMCAFHSARVISKLGQRPFGNLPTPDLVARLRACADILNAQVEIYPTTKLLRSGIYDLIHDAERNSGGSSPLRSGWESERPANPGVPQATNSVFQIPSQAPPPDVYSKYSVTDEIRKLRFANEDSEIASNLPMQHVGTGPLVGQLQTHDEISRQSFTITPLVRNEVTEQYDLAPQILPAGAPSFMDTNFEGTTYDVFMTLGFDSGYQEGQPDLFLDTFLPLRDDWATQNMDNI
jgi:hypothetical protein